MDLIDRYYDELVEWSAIIGNFRQLTKDLVNDEKFQFSKESNLEPYNSNTSLLYMAETEDLAEFVNGMPKFLVKYYLILSVGSSTDINEPANSAPNGNFKNCIFHLDYFWVNPLKINEIECSEESCQIDKKLTNFLWCKKCHGTYYSANNLINLMHPRVRFMRIPKNSIIYIGKMVTEIDNSPECMARVKKFLEFDKQKMDVLRAWMDDADERLKKITMQIENEKLICQEKINKLLSTRGGSMEKYFDMLRTFA